MLIAQYLWIFNKMQKPGSEAMFLVHGGKKSFSPSLRWEDKKKVLFQMWGKVVVVAYFPFSLSVPLCAGEYNVLIQT